jgi:hypothetical protein
MPSLVSQTLPDALRYRKNHLLVIVDGQSVPFLDHSLLDRLSGGRARFAAVDSCAEIITFAAENAESSLGIPHRNNQYAITYKKTILLHSTAISARANYPSMI